MEGPVGLEDERTSPSLLTEKPSTIMPAPEPDTREGFSPTAFLLGFSIYLGIGLSVAWSTEIGQALLKRFWWVVLVGFVVVAAAVQFRKIRSAFTHTSAQRRIGLVIFIAVPVMLVGMFTLFLLRTVELQIAALRVVFLGVVCCLPAVMYYLFIATKKSSLLNEFMISLDRLGLLTPRHLHGHLVLSGLAKEGAEERRKRMLTYVQKFEAVYGAVPTELGNVVLDPTVPMDRSLSGPMRRIESPGNVFTLDTAIPVLIATILVALGWLITLPPWEGQFRIRDTASSVAVAINAVPGIATDAAPIPVARPWADRWADAFSPLKTPVHFAFIGAYFFSLQMLFRRYVRRDLRASAYVAVSQRIILSVIGTWVAVEAALLLSGSGGTSGAADTSRWTITAKDLMVLGFVIGVFPRVAWQVIQAAVKRFTGAAVLLPTLQAQLPISDLDGLTVWHEARFEEEDIENIPNLATADLVDLLINTRFPPDRLVDWVDQAILYTHLGPAGKDEKPGAREILRSHGIRTASSLIEVYDRSADHDTTVLLEKVLDGPAAPGPSRLQSLVDAVQTNPNLVLIQTWRGMHAHRHAVVKAQKTA
jgi:hypothetical protein